MNQFNDCAKTDDLKVTWEFIDHQQNIWVDTSREIVSEPAQSVWGQIVQQVWNNTNILRNGSFQSCSLIKHTNLKIVD